MFYPPSAGNPHGGYCEAESHMEWLSQVYSKIPSSEVPLHCTQEAGEVMYVPEGWYHAVTNEGDAVGVAAQNSEPSAGTIEEHIHGVMQM